MAKKIDMGEALRMTGKTDKPVVPTKSASSPFWYVVLVYFLVTAVLKGIGYLNWSWWVIMIPVFLWVGMLVIGLVVVLIMWKLTTGGSNK